MCLPSGRRRTPTTEMRLVFLTQVLDADHPALAQTLDLVDALARRADEVTVLCDRVGRYDLPANVRIHVFGASSRVVRGARFERALSAELLRRDRPAAVISHMIPVFLTLAAPLARLRRIPLLLWYTHWNADRSLRIAVRLADRVLSVDERSFPLTTPKLVATGHAIDVELFSPGPPAAPRPDDALRLLALGRITPWKGYDTLLAALARAVEHGLDARLAIYGPALKQEEEAHRRELEQTIATTAVLGDRVRLEPPVARERLPEILRNSDVLVSATQPDRSETLDKVVYEAAACGLPVLSSNVALTEFLDGAGVELLFPRRDPDALAAALERLGALSPTERSAVGRTLRRRVVEGHSVESWADSVVRLVAHS
jgi:glycosyltransferase involved in cell wall biosynthesis